MAHKEIKSGVITDGDLLRLRNALEYTLATVSSGGRIPSTEKIGWDLVHGGRAHQSAVYLEEAIGVVNEIMKYQDTLIYQGEKVLQESWGG